ncbi:IS21 family transposase [Streptomyces lunaelactis]|uniref:IS21 family transposase n=1 Tax=Streptomyces lunaelactis TaxID=1535768 RepID=UPI001585147B|nr:IS21 family transposase [Streptomyces lunaelactis]NUK06549.1 IS21 family transposase [Streptomyces lunaelactis]NUK60539.1 IS21 family transposase [Streptomyces lunaelactis]NUK75211.1 IS21 family transposase [Streptomyces lunaelactis]NUK81326.1 IS21 family transposase [Streptomyces lunaelactis]NUL14573.1 IS21 family transposase [Streptomyces lunaelactis]
MSKVELYAAIRRDHRGGMSMRELERKHGVTWRTVRKALDSSWPEPRKKLPPRATTLDPYKPVIDDILRTDLDAPRKQRHTVTRIFHRLVEEHGADVSYGVVRYYVAGRKPEILVESGKAPLEAFVPQTHLPGHEAEVDFGDVTVRLAGELVTCYLFSFRLSYSGKAVHRVFASCGQEAFFEGHVHALRTLGGVPRTKVRYDNLKAAVARVLGQSRGRVEADRWIAFRSHFGIESFYCRPGIEGAHEKGGVEGMIGYFRRNHFVPVPEVSSLAELNEMVEQWDRQDDAGRIGSRPKTVAEYFALEQPLLMPLPEEPFETGRVFTPRVDRYGQIPVRTNRYSVPIRLIGKRVRVVLHASHLVVYDQNVEVARHERLIAKGAVRLDLDHYLEVLVRKPGAFPGSTALEQARSAGRFTPVHDAWWDQARRIHGERDGTRALIEVLLLGRHLPHEHVVAGLAAALRAGAMTADAVALEARKAAQAETEPTPSAGQLVSGKPPATVTSLHEWRLAHLPADTRPLPSVTPYDQLLRRRRTSGGDHREGEAQ